MSTSIVLAKSTERPALSIQTLQRRAPAVFADHQYDEVGSRYVFISTRELVEALAKADFHPTDVSQRWSRGRQRRDFARHMIRFRQGDGSIRIADCMPEIILVNSHDGSSCYQLRGGLYRFVCSNGLIVSRAEFGLIRIPHRGDVLANVVEGARQITKHLDGVGRVIERMVQTELSAERQKHLAQRALELRFAARKYLPFNAQQLLAARRQEDAGSDLWSVYNRVQENVIVGGIYGRTAAGRSNRSRPISAIDETVRLNVGLWQEAMALIRG